jgi:predicted nuclease of restriction endonuclease-like (RecB) superfamily
MKRTPRKDEARIVRGRQRDGASFPAVPSHLGLPADYATLLADIKERIRSGRLRAVMAANSAMVLLYWEVGRLILDRQEKEGWGARVIDRLSADLRSAFPDMAGLSPRNLKYMRAFAAAWPEPAIVQEALAQIPWYHHIALLEKCHDAEERLWYARQSAALGWSHNVLKIQIESRARERTGKAVNNFALTLPPADSDLAAQVFKDPYLFKNKLVAEYALRGFAKPIGVAGWETQIAKKLPKELKGSLPTVAEIEAELAEGGRK